MITAIIPLKRESIRVPNKNFKSFGDTNLLDLKLKYLNVVNEVDNILINTDSVELINDLNLKYSQLKKLCFVLREPYFASSKCSGSEFFENIATNAVGDVLIYSPVTSPFVKPDSLRKGIEIYKNNEYDSVVSVFDMKHHMWMNNKPLNYNPYSSPNSQDLPTIYKITYGFGIISKKLMIEKRNIIGNNPHFFELNELESVDIDTNLDFEFAEFLYKKEL